MLLGNEYLEQYLDEKKIVNVAYTNQICSAEKEINKDITEWTRDDLLGYIQSRNETSHNVVSVLISNFNKFREFICEKENIPFEKFEDINVNELINLNDLLFITFKQYSTIRRQMKLNTRDRLLLELSWFGVEYDQIKNLKESDIEFKTDKDNNDFIIFNLKDKKPLRCDDKNLIDDIRKVLNENYYYIEASDGRSKKMMYRDNLYLIKTPKIGYIGSKGDMMNNPSRVLQRAIVSQNIECDDIDLSHLTMTAIRRSSLIYMLSPQFKDYYDVNLIKEIYDFKTDSELYWLKKFAKIKYPSEN